MSRHEADSRRLVTDHLRAVAPAIESLLQNVGTLAGWGVEMAERLMAGQRLLAAGNGGSAAEAQHLTAELVGRFDGEREPFSAISLHAESSAVTAIANDYGFDRMFARQVTAHGRRGDILLLLSTSGKSPNLLHAVDAARAAGVTTWALTAAGPNPLTECVDDFVAIDAKSANAQEGHLIALHAICRAFDAEVHRRRQEEQR
ncbi:D-sedoheptulose-7-phosphate isomerase [Arthrobacter sp. MDT1-65]